MKKSAPREHLARTAHRSADARTMPPATQKRGNVSARLDGRDIAATDHVTPIRGERIVRNNVLASTMALAIHKLAHARVHQVGPALFAIRNAISDTLVITVASSAIAISIIPLPVMLLTEDANARPHGLVSSPRRLFSFSIY